MLKARKISMRFTRHTLNNNHSFDLELNTHLGATYEGFNTFLLSKPDKPLSIEHAFALVDSYNRRVKVEFFRHLKKVSSAEWLELEKPDDDRNPVAVVLPEPDLDSGIIRLSYYTKNGPIHHEIYPSKLAAIEAAFRQGYNKVKEGALDALVGTDDWERGMYICQWAKEGISPYNAIMSAPSGSEIYMLWRDFIDECKSKAA